MNTPEEIKKFVRDKYASIVVESKENPSGSCGCGCSKETEYSVFAEDYSALKGYEPDADLGLGCGLPTQYAFIRPGDIVVDLGSGAGNDCFVARKETGETGRVIGIDMTEPMIFKARENARRLGYENVEFYLGEIEHLPLAENFADVVVSNCVFNLVPDKGLAFVETFRVLKPGGHFSISDMVLDGKLPEAMLKEAELYAGCVAGAIPESDYLAKVEQSGFKEIQVLKRRKIELPVSLTGPYDPEGVFSQPGGPGIYSITVFARKPLS